MRKKIRIKIHHVATDPMSPSATFRSNSQFRLGESASLSPVNLTATTGDQ